MLCGRAGHPAHDMPHLRTDACWSWKPCVVSRVVCNDTFHSHTEACWEPIVPAPELAIALPENYEAL